MTARPVAVGITTRNRPQSLNACVASLAFAAALIDEVFIFDDASDPAAAVTIPAALQDRVTMLRDATAPGYIVGRNRLIRRASASFVLLLDDDTRILNRESIAEQSRKHRVPLIHPNKTFALAGGLMSYGPDTIDIHRRTAEYVDRILSGEKAADLPVQAPTKYELVINLKTAKALGLNVSNTLIGRADQLIE